MKILIMLISLYYPPCATEDSNNCYWDAQARGNGVGTSFVVIDNEVIRLQVL